MHHDLGCDYASVDADAVPNLAAAKAAGLAFVFVRGSWGRWQDPMAVRDRAAIRAAGLMYGAYVGPDIDIKAPAPEEQVDTFAAGAGLVPWHDLPPVIDLEMPRGIIGTGMTLLQIDDWIGRLVAAVEAHFGCYPIDYSSARVLDGSDSDALRGSADKILAGCPLWLARYPFATRIAAQPGAADTLPAPPVPAAIGDSDAWWFHQYQGDAIRFPGFSATIDLDRFNRASSSTQGTRRAWLCQNALGKDSATDEELDAGIRAFQTRFLLEPDGIVGLRTFAAMGWNRGGEGSIEKKPLPPPT